MIVLLGAAIIILLTTAVLSFLAALSNPREKDPADRVPQLYIWGFGLLFSGLCFAGWWHG